MSTRRGPRLPTALLRELGVSDQTKSQKKAPPKPSKPQRTALDGKKKPGYRTFTEPQAQQNANQISRRTQAKIAEDDAEIAKFERRLGLKPNGSKLPKSFDDDGLVDLLDGLEDPLNASDDDDQRLSKKRGLSQEEEDWLRSKRIKATASSDVAWHGEPDDSDVSSLDEDEDNEDFSGPSDFDGFDNEQQPKSKVRENPYVAPQTAESIKYIPPSLRQEETDGLRSLRRQIQGTLNRLSEAKILAVATEIDKIYQQNARQHVTSILLDVLFSLICDPSPLQDTFMILHGGFVAALYRMLGAEFGAQVIQRAIEEHDRILQINASTRGKRLNNLITFLAELYEFRVIGSLLMYDLVQSLTVDLTEDNVEMLLRIVRMSGSQLRHDNSAFFKDLVAALHAHQEAVGAENLSVRIKFMIETVENLKKNRAKKGVEASTIRIEHTSRMRKTLEMINKSSVRSSQPLGIGLQDVRNADKKGRWWLVGASFKDDISEQDKAHPEASKHDLVDDPVLGRTTDMDADHQTLSDDLQWDFGWGTNAGADLEKLAREQGMNTEIRRAVFITLLSAFDSVDACQKLDKLGMKSKQRLEVPRVVVHCLRAENKQYNPFYLEIAKHCCRDRNLRKAFSFTLWDLIKRVEEKDEDNDDNLAGHLNTTAMAYMGKLYAGLVGEGLQSVLLLKHVDLIRPVREIKIFTQVFLITILQDAGRKSKERHNKVKRVFAEAEKEPQMIQPLRMLLQRIGNKMATVKGSKDERREAKRVILACQDAEKVLLELTSKDTDE